MLKTTGLIQGHYECRSLTETLPVFTDLLAAEVIEQRAGEATVKHPNTDWRLVVHEGGPNAPEKSFDNHYGFRVGSHQEVQAAWEYLEANPAEVEAAHGKFAAEGRTLGVTDLGNLERAGGNASFIFSDLDRNWWELTAGARW